MVGIQSERATVGPAHTQTHTSKEIDRAEAMKHPSGSLALSDATTVSSMSCDETCSETLSRSSSNDEGHDIQIPLACPTPLPDDLSSDDLEECREGISELGFNCPTPQLEENLSNQLDDKDATTVNKKPKKRQNEKRASHSQGSKTSNSADTYGESTVAIKKDMFSSLKNIFRKKERGTHGDLKSPKLYDKSRGGLRGLFRSNSSKPAKSRSASTSSSRMTKPKDEYDMLYALDEIPFHGEDSGYCDKYMQIVADGVGGTKASSAPLAAALVSSVAESLGNAMELNKKAGRNLNKPKGLSMEEFLSATQAGISDAIEELSDQQRMASALTVTYINPYTRELLSYVVGDTKTIVFRKCEPVFESTSLVHEFNVPVSISNVGIDIAEHPCLTFSYQLEKDDVVMTCSDGASDNLFADDISKIIDGCTAKSSGRTSSRKKAPLTIATRIAQMSKVQSASVTRGFSPFSISAVLDTKDRIKEQQSGNRRLDDVELTREEVYDINKLCEKHGGREMFNKEFQLNVAPRYYNTLTLYHFATRKTGKEDDITVCVSILQ